MASEDHNPWCLMCSKGTPFWKAQAAPALLKAWKVRGWGRASFKEICFRCFLAVESVRIEILVVNFNRNRGSFFPAGMWAIMDLRALIGHRGESPRPGITMVLICFLFWIVFDHLTIMVAFCSLKMRSPLVRCLVTSKVVTEWAKILESLKKEKNVRR